MFYLRGGTIEVAGLQRECGIGALQAGVFELDRRGNCHKDPHIGGSLYAVGLSDF